MAAVTELVKARMKVCGCDGKWSNTMAATIKDIAQKTGLGLATISSYLNGNVRGKKPGSK